MDDAFFTHKYKTRWCPIGVQHEWHMCVYAHNYQDARRPVSIGYGARLCPYWSKKDTGAEYSQRCPLGLRCPYSHGAKEQLYHPHYFKTVVCRDLRGKACPRSRLCAFFHTRQERRRAPPDEVDYTQPLENEALPSDWIQEFLSPPFLPEVQYNDGGGQQGEYYGEAIDSGNGVGNGIDNGHSENGNGEMLPYMAQVSGQHQQDGMCMSPMGNPQGQMVFLMPMPMSQMGGAMSQMGHGHAVSGIQQMSAMQQMVFVPLANGCGGGQGLGQGGGEDHLNIPQTP